MRILVTGGAGFIGSHIVDAYVAEGHEVHVVDDLSSGRREHVNEAATFHAIDIRAPELAALFADVRPDIVNHHAAQASVKVSTADPAFDLAVNGAGTANVALLCAEHGVRKLIYAGSGGTVYGEPEAVPIPETARGQPRSPYGVSKLVGEEYVRYVGRTSPVETTILRYGNVFGPRQDPTGEAGVVAIFARLMLRREACTIDGDGDQVKDYVYVGDVARANVLALEAGDGAALNIGTGRGTSVNTIFDALRRATGDATEPRHGPPRPGDIYRMYLDASAARDVIGWAPEMTFEEGIRLTVEALRRSGG